jgi:hypothetical protein
MKYGEKSALSTFIKQTWHYLTDDEVAAHDDMRDVFFMAVRKKHGIPRAEAENTLRSFLERLNFMRQEALN